MTSKKMFAFLLGGYEYSTYFSNQITQNTVLSDGLFFTQGYFLKVKVCPEQIHSRLQWDIALNSRFFPQNVAFIYAAKSMVCVWHCILKTFS